MFRGRWADTVENMAPPDHYAPNTAPFELIDLERFFDLSVNLLCIANADSTFRRVSPAFTTVLGWSAEELCARPFLSFVHPGDLEATLGVMATLTAGATTIDFENRYSCKDGSWRVLRWNSAPDTSSGLIYASAQDVTEQVESRAALAESKRWIEQILDMAGEGIVEVDAQGLFTYANPVACRLLGVGGDEIIGRSPFEIASVVEVDGVAADPEQTPMRRVLRSGGTGGGLIVLRRRDGTCVSLDVTVSSVPSTDGARNGAVSVMRDASERLRSQAVLAEQAAALERSNVELRQFAYVASHDLQEPLRKISSYVQILEEDYSDRLDDEGRECIAFAVDGALRMRQLIEDLLAVARVRVDNMSFGACDTAAIVAGVLDDLDAPIAESGAVVDVSGLPVVVGDAAQLRQVFQNLVSNAVKYRGAAAPVVRVAAEATAEGWLFSVADNGTGFAQEYAERVFGMFQRLVGRSQAAGTGIGLAIARKAVENHGGTIWAESEPGVGTTFRFTLPTRVRERPFAPRLRDAA